MVNPAISPIIPPSMQIRQYQEYDNHGNKLRSTNPVNNYKIHKNPSINKIESTDKVNKPNFSKILKSNKAKYAHGDFTSAPENIQETEKSGDNGTNLAVRNLAIDFEKQFLGFMWNQAFAAGVDEYEGGIGEELFRKELTNEMINDVSAGEMSEIAQNIYDEVVGLDEPAPNALEKNASYENKGINGRRDRFREAEAARGDRASESARIEAERARAALK